jgi:hypothetical protein
MTANQLIQNAIAMTQIRPNGNWTDGKFQHRFYRTEVVKYFEVVEMDEYSSTVIYGDNVTTTSGKSTDMASWLMCCAYSGCITHHEMTVTAGKSGEPTTVSMCFEIKLDDGTESFLDFHGSFVPVG